MEGYKKGAGPKVSRTGFQMLRTTLPDLAIRFGHEGSQDSYHEPPLAAATKTRALSGNQSSNVIFMMKRLSTAPAPQIHRRWLSCLFSCPHEKHSFLSRVTVPLNEVYRHQARARVCRVG